MGLFDSFGTGLWELIKRVQTSAPMAAAAVGLGHLDAIQ